MLKGKVKKKKMNNDYKEDFFKTSHDLYMMMMMIKTPKDIINYWLILLYINESCLVD